MLKLLERNVSNVDQHLTVLASPRTEQKLSFSNLSVDSLRYGSMLTDLQRLRGKVYLGDGAIGTEHLTRDGRHDTPEDHKSWHIVMHDERRNVTGCIWYMEHASPSFEALRLRHSPLMQSNVWSAKLKAAVEQDIARAKQERIGFAEVGGWAVSSDSNMTDCLLLILGTYALSQVLGGAYVMATATVRHSSAAILRRLGGAPLSYNGQDLPPYHDRHYGCAMELLRFDTRRPASKFVRLVDCFKAEFATLPVLANEPHASHNSAHTPIGSAHLFGGQPFRQRSVA